MRIITVIVCTRNREEMLGETLASLSQCPVPDGWQAQFVVVDNGSTDGTPMVAELAKSKDDRFEYVFESKAGLSNARNAGIAKAKGEYIAFTDDDCSAAKDWLVALIKAFDADPQISCLFGRVLPYEGGDEDTIVATKTETKAQRFRYPCSPFVGHGNNMNFRRAPLIDVGLFDVALGAGAPLRSAEDLDMAYRLLRRGDTLAYEPSCVIYHRPRDSKDEVMKTHWRNAVGMGACYGKHMLRGDLHAYKCVYWFVSGLVGSFFKQLLGKREELKTKQLYLVGLPYGMWQRLVYNWFKREKFEGKPGCR